MGITYFKEFYARSSNVFGAVPSLHTAYAFVAWFYARPVFPRGHWIFLAFWALMGFAAVYLRHHYTIDVLLGAIYAYAAGWAVERHAKKVSGTFSETEKGA